MKKIKKSASLPILTMAVYILLILTRIIPSEAFGNTAALFAALVILEVTVFALPSFTYCRLFSIDYVGELGIRAPSARSYSKIALFCLVALFGALTVNSLIYLTGLLDESLFMTGPLIFSEAPVRTQFLYVFFAYAMIPAICEEFLFRGILFSGYFACFAGLGGARRFLSASVLSSVLYAMAGFDFAGFFSRFFVGMVLCCAVFVTRSLVSAILVRFACGILSVYLVPALRNMVIQPLMRAFAFLFIPTVFLLSLVFLFLVLEREYLKRAHDPSYSPSSADSLSSDDNAPAKKSRTARNSPVVKALLSPFFIACVVFFAVSSSIILVL